DVVLVESSDRDDLDIRMLTPEPSGRLDPIHPWKVDIHQHDVRRSSKHRLQRLLSRADRPQDLQPFFPLDEQLDRLREHGMVVNHEHPDHVGHSGIRSRRRVAAPAVGRVLEKVAVRPGSLSAQIVPPWSSTIRRAMYSPRPDPGTRSIPAARTRE